MSGPAVESSAPVGRRARAVLARVEDLAPTAVPPHLGGRPATPDEGWTVDDRALVVATRVGGAPAGRVAEEARRVLAGYRMADPTWVRGCWRADDDLDGRRMVLEGRFGPLRFAMPTVVDLVVDQHVDVAGRVARVVGWSYTTLQGHLERGWMDWSVWHFDDDRVEVRTHTVAAHGEDPGAVVALGRAVFGRAVQTAFTRSSLRRWARLSGGRPDASVRPRSADVPGALAVVLGPR